MKFFTPAMAGKSESVVVMAGGPSATSNLDRLKQYISENRSKVLVANYDYGIKADYTYFGDKFKLIEQIKNIKSDIIVSQKIAPDATKFLGIVSKKIYKIAMKSSKSPGIYASRRVVFSKEGVFPYNGIGTSGLACLAISLFFEPSSILAVGFDGPSPDSSVKRKFDGSIVGYGKPQKRKKEISYVKKSLFPSILEKGIKIRTFSDVLFYGLNKSELGVEVI